MRSPFLRDFLTGLFSIAGLAGLIIMLMLFGELTNFGHDRYSFLAHVNNAGGLTDTSPVTLNGVKVGQISATRVRAGGGAELELRVDRTVRIPRSAVASIDRSLVGDATLEFTIPPDLADDELANYIAEGETVDIGDASSLINRLAGMVEKPLSKIAQTAENIDRLAATYNTVGERINAMLEPRTLAEVDQGAEPNLRTAIARADAALAGAGRWLDDEELLTRTKATIAKAERLADQATEVTQELSRAATAAREGINDANAKVAALSEQASTTLKSTEAAVGRVTAILESVQRGEGTVGQLMTNPDLYRSLQDASARLDLTLQDLQLAIEKFKKEGVRLGL